MSSCLNTHSLPPSSCPTCGYVMDRATNATEESGFPDPGDFSVCLQCAAVLVFDANLMPMLASTADLATLEEGEREALARAVKAVCWVISERLEKPRGRQSKKRVG